MAYPEFNFEEHVMKHFFAYCRLCMIIVSWFFLIQQPVIFMGFIFSSIAIGNLDKLILNGGKIEEVTTMINTIVDKITTYILIFSVIAHLK
jgi:hypothetical protein